MTVTVSAKGQLVIPAAIRKRYKLLAHAKVDVIDTGHSIIIRPLPKGDPFLASRGILKGKLSTAQFLKWRHQENRRENTELT
jgi:AbrB family looped-hinge helix DNA binding protein